MTKQALFITSFSSPEQSFEWRDLQTPPLEPDEVEIKVEAFGLNYADIMARKGLYAEAPDLPFVPGYEVVGEVVSVAGNSKKWLGKRVLAFTRFGGYATHAVSKQSALVEIERNVDSATALALATQYATAYYATHIAQKVNKDDIVLIQAAAGGVGIALNQMCKYLEAKTIGLCGSQSKMDFCLTQGYDFVFSYSDEQYLNEIKKLFPNGIDVCFNSLAGKSFKNEMKLLGFGSKMVLFGASSRSDMKGGFFANLKMVWQMGIVIPIALMMKSRSVIGINMLKIADYKPETLSNCMTQVFELYKSGVLVPVIGEVFDAKDIAKGHLKLENRESIGKIVCKF